MKILPQRFYAHERELGSLEESFRKGKFFVERKSDQKWLLPLVHPSNLCEDSWTNDPLKAMGWSSKPLAELEIIRMGLNEVAIVTEHLFIDP